MKNWPTVPPEVSKAITRAEQPAYEVRRELAQVTALLVGMIRLVEDPALAEFPPGLWEWWDLHKAEHIEH